MGLSLSLDSQCLTNAPRPPAPRLEQQSHRCPLRCAPSHLGVLATRARETRNATIIIKCTLPSTALLCTLRHHWPGAPRNQLASTLERSTHLRMQLLWCVDCIALANTQWLCEIPTSPDKHRETWLLVARLHAPFLAPLARQRLLPLLQPMIGVSSQRQHRRR